MVNFGNAASTDIGNDFGIPSEGLVLESSRRSKGLNLSPMAGRVRPTTNLTVYAPLAIIREFRTKYL